MNQQGSAMDDNRRKHSKNISRGGLKKSGKNNHGIDSFKGAKIGQKAFRPRRESIFTLVSQYFTIGDILSDTTYRKNSTGVNFAPKELIYNSYEFFLVNYPDVTERPLQLRPSTSDTAFRT